MIEEIVIRALGIVVASAPGLLAALTGRQTDEEAIDAARAEVAKIEARPAGSALDEYEKRVTSGR